MTKFGYAIVIGFVAVLAGSLYLGFWFKNRPETQPIDSTPVVATTTVPISNTNEATSTATTTLLYENTDFGFSLTLPRSWDGYKVATGTVQYGRTITITPPSSIDEGTREFVPVLIYPIDKWTEWEKNNFEDYPTAAPIGPTERARNKDYVFATAPRYNFGFGADTKVVEEIVEKMKAF